MPSKKDNPEPKQDEKKSKKANKTEEQGKKGRKAPNVEVGKKSRSNSPNIQGRNTDEAGNVCFSIIWFFILVCVAFKLAFFCAIWYIMFLPFTACLEGCTPFTDFLLFCVQFPYFCTKAMLEGRGFTSSL